MVHKIICGVFCEVRTEIIIGMNFRLKSVSPKANYLAISCSAQQRPYFVHWLLLAQEPTNHRQFVDKPERVNGRNVVILVYAVKIYLSNCVRKGRRYL